MPGSPLFIPPSDPHWLWLLVLIPAIPAAVIALVGLVRGKLSPSLAFTGLFILPTVAFALGNITLMEESKGTEFCGSCHVTMGPVLESVMSDDGSLAATHIANATIPVTQGCYTCHSGYGIWGTVGAKSAGVLHMLHTVTGNYEYPLKTTGQFDIGSCLNCHSRGKKFRAAAPHQDPSIAKLLLEGTMSCAGTCHPAAHPESALMGAEAK